MNVLYCGDSHIETGLVLSVMSVSRQVAEVLHIYVLTMELDTEEQYYAPVSDGCIASMQEYIRTKHPDSTVEKIDISHLFRQMVPEENLATRFTPYCMLRLFADQIPRMPDKILYLDSDVLCRMDCTPFYHQDITDYEFAGVLDYYGSWFFRNNIFKRDYVNSGVLLLNMQKIRQTGLFRKCLEMCRTKKMFMPDQSALNKLASAKKLEKRRFNEQRKLHDDTVFQHFTTSFRLLPWLHTVSVKPWQFDLVHKTLKLHEYDDLFEEYQTMQFIQM